MIPPDSIKQKLDGVVDSVPPNKGCEVLDRKLNHEKWDESEKFIDSDDSHILLKWGVIIKCYEGENFQKVLYDPLQLSTKE